MPYFIVQAHMRPQSYKSFLNYQNFSNKKKFFLFANVCKNVLKIG